MSAEAVIGNTDAVGEVGRRVAERLAARGVRQRLLVPAGTPVPDLPDADVATFTNYGDAASVREALTGVTTLLFIPMREHAERARMHVVAVDAALDAGVERIVYSSFVGAGADSTFTLARDHAATEQHLRSTGVPFTFLRGSAYMEVLRWIIGGGGVIRGPAGDGRVAPVARDDMADTAAAVLLSGGAHDGQTYDVTGPQRLTLGQVADEFSVATGRQITYVDETVEEAWASRRSYGAPDWQVEAWVSTYLQIAAGELDVVSDSVERIAGHLPVALPEFLRRHPKEYEHLL